MKQFLGVVMAVLVGCAGVQSQRDYKPSPKASQETPLLKNNELRVIIHAPNTSGLPRTGSPIDRELSLIELFARSHKLTLKFVPVMHRSELFDALLNGHGDLIAAQLTHTTERAKRMQFSAPIRYVSEQVVVAKSAKRFPKNPNELAKHGRKQGAIWVQPGSSFVETIQRLSAKQGQTIHVTHIDQSLTTDELLYRVASGQYAISVADSNSVEAYMSYRNDLKVAFTLKEQVPTAWAIHPQNSGLLAAVNRFISYNVSPQRSAQIALDDLPEIKRRGRLRVAMPNNAASYFLHGGMPIGYQYRLAKRFAKELGVRLEVIIPRRQMDLIELLTSGHVDMLAATLTITSERQKKMAFSKPLTVVDEVLVQRTNDPSITRIEDLAGHQIHVRKNSAYWLTLKTIQAQVPSLKLVAAPEELETESLIAMVKSGQLSSTASDFDILAVELAFGDALKGTLVLKNGIQRAFATRKKSPRLLSAINLFVKKQLTLRGKSLLAPVAKPGKAMKKAPKSKAQISTLHTPFDGLINEAAKRNKLDPRLLKAVIQTGSQFDPHAVSSIGETGLMQLLPHVSAQMGVAQANLHTPKDNLRVGAAYLAHLLRTLELGLTSQTRLQFALAAYKVGQGHVDDARRLAKTVLGLDPNRWAGNVAKALPLLSHRRYARQAKHGYCRGQSAVTFVTAVTKLITSR